jgi:aerobic carbon-monoxide dehydrogenase large subunit
VRTHPRGRLLALFSTHLDYNSGEQVAEAVKKIVSLTLVNQRVVANYLDTRGVVAEYDAANDRLALTLSSRGPHAIRDVLLQVLRLPAAKLRVMTPDCLVILFKRF